MDMMSARTIIPLIWVASTGAYFLAVFLLPRPELVVPDMRINGILEIWIHELMRSGPTMIPGFGAAWGILSGIGFAHTSFFVMGNGSEYSPLYGIFLFPFLSLHIFAQGVMIRRGILIILEIKNGGYGTKDDYSQYSTSAMAAEWGGQEADHVSANPNRFMPIIKPFLRDLGIFMALLFASAAITFLAWGDSPSSTTIQAFWMYDGMLDYMVELPMTTSLPTEEIESALGTVWESLT